MNERIEKLAIECYQAPEFDYKKFAELIVKDCMTVVTKSGNSKAEILNGLEEMIYETDARNQE